MFLTKIIIFDQNCYFRPKLLFSDKIFILTKICIFDQHFHFWPKFSFLTKISNFDLFSIFSVVYLFRWIFRRGRPCWFWKYPSLDFGYCCGCLCLHRARWHASRNASKFDSSRRKCFSSIYCSSNWPINRRFHHVAHGRLWGRSRPFLPVEKLVSPTVLFTPRSWRKFTF